MNIAGVVLAGGQSSRFGRPKMFELLNNLPLYHYSLDALKKNHLSRYIIATNDDLHPFFQQDENVTFLIEKTKHQGPLFVLNQLLQTFKEVDWFFIIAADMPYMNAEFIHKMLHEINTDYDAIIPKQSTRIQPLAGLYHRTTLEKITELIVQERRSMKALLDLVHVHYIPFSDEDPIFTNINHQHDLPKGDLT